MIPATTSRTTGPAPPSDAPGVVAPEPEPVGEPLRVFDPWNALRPVSFPMDALPPILRGFIANRARIIGADSGAIAWACLSACSAAIHGAVRLRMKRHDSWSVPPALWVSLVGDPSTKKTPIISAAWDPLNRRQADEMRVFKIALNKWKALSKKEQAQEPRPSMIRLITHDSTTWRACRKSWRIKPAVSASYEMSSRVGLDHWRNTHPARAALLIELLHSSPITAVLTWWTG